MINFHICYYIQTNTKTNKERILTIINFINQNNAIILKNVFKNMKYGINIIQSFNQVCKKL